MKQPIRVSPRQTACASLMFAMMIAFLLFAPVLGHAYEGDEPPLSDNDVLTFQYTPVSPITLIENVDGEYESVVNEDGTTQEYFRYVIPSRRGDTLTVIYMAGHREEFVLSRDATQGSAWVSTSGDGRKLTVDEVSLSSQAFGESWDAGAHKASVWFQGIHRPLKVTVIANDVTAIDYQPVDAVRFSEYGNGSWVEAEGSRFFRYDFEIGGQHPGDTLAVTRADGVQTRYTLNSDYQFVSDGAEDEPINARDLTYSDDQSPENPWQVGENHQITVSYRGCSADIDVAIIAGTDTSIEYTQSAPLTLRAYEHGISHRMGWGDDGIWSDNPWFEYSLSEKEESFGQTGDTLVVNPGKEDEKSYVVEVQTDGTARYTNVADSNDVMWLPNAWTTDQSSAAPWGIGSHAATFTYCGAVAEVAVTLEPKAIAVPHANEGLVYNATEQIGVPAGEGYVLADAIAVEPGAHIAVASLESDFYIWEDNTTTDKEIEWSIGRIPVEIPAVSESKVYSGSEQTAIPETSKYTVEGGSATDAGDYTATVRLKNAQHYEWSDGTTDDKAVPWRIVPKAITVPSPVEDLVYDGEEKVGVPAGEGYVVEGGSAVSAGTHTATASLESGNYVWSDGTDEPETIEWSIAKAPVDAPEATTGLVYDGSEQVGVPSGVGYSVEGGKATDAGNYIATVIVDDENAYWSDGTEDIKTIEWFIFPKKIDVPAPAGGLVYDGEEKVGVPAGEGYVVEGGSAVSAGTHTATASLESGNYVWSDGTDEPETIEWSIAKAPVDAPEATTGLVYDGSEQVGVPSGVGYSVEGGKATDAGNYIATVIVDEQNAYWSDDTQGSKTVEWSIAKALIPLPVANRDLVYNGEKQVGVSGNDYITIENGSAVDAGDYTAIASISDSNYTFENGMEEVTIPWSIARATMAPADVPVATDLVYNGEVQIGVTSGIGYAVADNEAVPGGYCSRAVDAGDYTALIVSDSNHVFEGIGNSLEVPWSIARAEIAIPEVVQGISYDGTNKTGVSSGTGYSVEGGSATDAGDYTAVVSADSNHQFTGGLLTVELPWVILKAKAALPPKGKVLTYSGKTQVGVPAGTGYSVTKNKAVNGGSYTAIASLLPNYQWADGSFDDKAIPWKITPAAQTVSAKKKTFTVKAKTVKKKSCVIAASKVTKGVTAKTAIVYTKVKANKKNAKFSVAKNGKVTLKKGLGKGVYKLTIKATAQGTSNYQSASKTFVVVIRVK